jgi:hypothetical protein
MPLQNRVDPWGVINASPHRGTMMGNRGGALHNDRRIIVRQFKSRQWIACLLEFRGRRRTVMSPGLYTELFFLDEATAFAAGHRPCAECRRQSFNAFRKSWPAAVPPSAPEIDRELHPARIDRQGNKITWAAPLDSLPDGVFIEIDRSSCLVSGEALLEWSPAGYTQKHPRPQAVTARVLTPEPIVHCFRRGYKPAIHPSSLAL